MKKFEDIKTSYKNYMARREYTHTHTQSYRHTHTHTDTHTIMVISGQKGWAHRPGSYRQEL